MNTTTVQILRGAYDLLEKRGWTQKPNLSSETGPICLGMAMGLSAMATSPLDKFFVNTGYDVAMRLLLKVIGVQLCCFLKWQDAPERTLEEIRAALSAAIAIAEQEPVPAEAMQ